MKWNETISSESITPLSSCQLIIVGETRDGHPFSYEDNFQVLQASEDHLDVSLGFANMNPLEKLHHVCFIEFSFRHQGILYFSFVDLLQLELKKSQCILHLSVPELLQTIHQRKQSRVNLPARTPITCRIVGVRKQSTHQCIAFNGQLLDLSGDGLSFITAVRLFYPLLLELHFHLPHESEKLIASGEIVRVTPFSSDSYRVAVEFMNSPDKVISQINQYCANHLDYS